LVWIGKTFGPTRSNSGDTEAAQEALRTRMFSGRFQGADKHASMLCQCMPNWPLEGKLSLIGSSTLASQAE
jgi:hypothetical protein